MRQIALRDNTDRIIDHRKIRVSDDIVLLILCILFAVLGVLLMRNEIDEDHWYIEATSDGLFGEDNRSIVTICSNYLITGLIYLLSLTGIRLFWYNILLILLSFVSSLLVCKVIVAIEKDWTKYLICFVFLILIGTRVFFRMQFTVVAAYTVSAGCLWLFYSIKRQTSKRSYLPGAILVILGAALRFNCIAFPLVFMGTVWLFKMAELFCENRWRTQEKGVFSKTIVRYFMPFAVALLLVVGFEASYQLLMERVNLGFRAWNQIRAPVDDYALPDYDSYAAQYQNIGLSRNDFLLSRTWNNYDPDFFTDEMFEKLLEIKDLHQQATVQNTPIGTSMLNVLDSMSGSIFLALGVVVSICAFLYGSAWAGGCCVTLLLEVWFFYAYFTYRGRLIVRIEWSIWIGMLLAMAAALLLFGPARSVSQAKSRIKGLLVSGFCVLILFGHPNRVASSRYGTYLGMSVAEIYKEQITNYNTYGRYLYETAIGNRIVWHGTYDEFGNEYFIQNKDKLFLATWNISEWLQTFPLPVRDVLRTAPMAAGENWCVLGQYFTHLKPMKQLYQKWQAGNLFKAMTNDYVRVVFKDTEMHDRSYEINTYLKEHYYEDANFSIEAVANRTVIGRYLQNFDSNDLYAISGDASVSYRKDSSYSGMSEIHLSNFDINGFSLMQDESYLAIHSGNGRTYTFTTMSEGEGQLKAIFYNDIVQEKGSYTVDFIYDHNGQLHVVSLGALPR